MELRVEDLACRRGEAVVLRGLSFAVRSGTATMLRGPNGAGKTTLLRTLAGLAPIAAGRIHAPPDAMAFSGHADGLKAQLTVAENLAFWARAFGTGDARAAADAFELAPLLGRRAADLSAGQRRRAGLARLLVTGRPIWLLDEPTVSLDGARAARFAAILRTHLAGGGAALIASHVPIGLPGADELDLRPYAATRQSGASDPFAEAVE